MWVLYCEYLQLLGATGEIPINQERYTMKKGNMMKNKTSLRSINHLEVAPPALS